MLFLTLHFLRFSQFLQLLPHNQKDSLNLTRLNHWMAFKMWMSRIFYCSSDAFFSCKLWGKPIFFRFSRNPDSFPANLRANL